MRFPICYGVRIPHRRGARLVIVAALLLPTFVGAGCAPQGEEADPAKSGVGESRTRVAPYRVARKNLVRYCEQPGRVAPFAETPLVARVPGYVARVHVDIGDEVKGPATDDQGAETPGQLLVEIAVPELLREQEQKAAAVAQAEAELRQAEAGRKVAESASESARAAAAEAEAGRERIAADIERWRSEYERVSELAKRQAVTAKLADETRSQLAAAQAEHKEVDARIRSAKARLAESESQIAKAAADVMAADARWNFAKADLRRVEALVAFREIRAPFSGVIAQRNADAGRLVGAPAASPLLVLVNMDKVRVVVDVPEVDAVHLASSAEMTIRAPSLAGDGISTRTDRSAWVLNQATRTLRVECHLENAERRLRPGMYVQARLKVAERPDAVVVPKTALMTATGETFCWKLDAEGRLLRQSVRTGLEAGGEIEVLEGLANGDEILGVNPAAFREGQQVDRATPKSP